MKKIFFAFLMLFLSALLFAEKAPDWLRSPEKVFPADRYMHALGEGKSREQAELSALASLTLSFKAHIAVFNKALEDFTLASEDGRTGFSQRETFSQAISLSSDAELFCLHFTDSYYNKRSKSYTVAAYISREEIRQLYEPRIAALEEAMQALSSLSQAETEPLHAAGLCHRAALLGSVAKLYIENLTVANPQLADQYGPLLSLIAETDGRQLAGRGEISFSITCSPERALPLLPVLAAILQENGFVYAKEGALYQISLEADFHEESYEAGDFVRPSLLLTVTDRQGRTVESYAKSYPRYGHKTLESAYNLALAKIRGDLEAHFLQAYRSL